MEETKIKRNERLNMHFGNGPAPGNTKEGGYLSYALIIFFSFFSMAFVEILNLQSVKL